jgi:hypothetical protein
MNTAWQLDCIRCRVVRGTATARLDECVRRCGPPLQVLSRRLAGSAPLLLAECLVAPLASRREAFAQLRQRVLKTAGSSGAWRGGSHEAADGAATGRMCTAGQSCSVPVLGLTRVPYAERHSRARACYRRWGAGGADGGGPTDCQRPRAAYKPAAAAGGGGPGAARRASLVGGVRDGAMVCRQGMRRSRDRWSSRWQRARVARGVRGGRDAARRQGGTAAAFVWGMTRGGPGSSKRSFFLS